MLAQRLSLFRSVAVAAAAATFAVAGSPAADARPPIVDVPALTIGDDGHDALGSELARPRSAVCERLVSLSERLGETYAGYRLRTTLLAQNCPFTSGRRIGHVWSWPWQAMLSAPVVTAAITPASPHDRDDFLPPRLRSVSGAWQIRCGRAGPRERCALATGGTAGSSLHAHFVIDRLAGKAAVVLRILAPVMPEKAAAVHVDIARQGHRIAVAACSPRGCMAEATPAASARVLDALWDGTPLSVSIESGTGREATLASSRLIAPDGFRDGFRQLLQLDRDDRNR